MRFKKISDEAISDNNILSPRELKKKKKEEKRAARPRLYAFFDCLTVIIIALGAALINALL